MLETLEHAFGVVVFDRRILGQCLLGIGQRLIGGGHMLVEKFLDLAFGLRAHEAIDRLAVLHQHAGGNAANAEGRGQLLLLVGVDLDQLETAFVIDLGLFQHRSQRFARAAPRGPEIHQHGCLHRRGDDFGFKIFYGDINHGKTR